MTPTPTTMTEADGWRLVPLEPTEEMLDAYWQQTGESRAMRERTHSYMRRYYRAMLSAAPPAPAPDDLRELREAAERASQGKWRQFHPTYCADAAGTPFSDWDSSHDMSALHEGRRKRIATFTHADDAAFVDAANPSTVLSLIDRIARLESENARLREAVEKMPRIVLQWAGVYRMRAEEYTANALAKQVYPEISEAARAAVSETKP